MQEENDWVEVGVACARRGDISGFMYAWCRHKQAKGKKGQASSRSKLDSDMQERVAKWEKLLEKERRIKKIKPR